MAQILKNNVSGVLGLALGASATSMTLLDASSFPTPPAGDFYLLTLIGLNANGQEASWEIVKVTGKASNTLTVVRAQEGTPAAAWPVATTVQLRLTAGSVVTPDALAGKSDTGHTHAGATTSTAGFMSATDKTKLDGVAENANNYTHPASHPASIIVQDANNRFVSDTEKAAWNAKEASGTAASAMSAHTSAADPHGQYLPKAGGTMSGPINFAPAQTWPTFNQSTTGNAGTATKLETARTINGVSFDGSANITVNAVDSTARVAATGGSASGLTLNGGYTEAVFAVTGTTPTLSPTNGSIQTWTLTGNSTPTMGAWNSGQSMTLLIDDGTAYSINWASTGIVWKTGGGTAPVLLTTGYTTLALVNVGGTVYGWLAGDA